MPDLLELCCPPAGLGVGTTSFSENNFFRYSDKSEAVFVWSSPFSVPKRKVYVRFVSGNSCKPQKPIVHPPDEPCEHILIDFGGL